MMRTGKVFTDGVDVSERLRRKDDARVKALAESMAEIGLQQPISIWTPNDETCDLVTGLHRRALRAADGRSDRGAPQEDAALRHLP